MTTITTKTKEITTSLLEKQTISEFENNATDKAQIFYTQLTVAQVFVSTMIEKMETMDLKYL